MLAMMDIVARTRKEKMGVLDVNGGVGGGFKRTTSVPFVLMNNIGVLMICGLVFLKKRRYLQIEDLLVPHLVKLNNEQHGMERYCFLGQSSYMLVTNTRRGGMLLYRSPLVNQSRCMLNIYHPH
ncbi:hypothetical protein QJS04_geneDACA004687 [Acorus gramineus]|uniref:Uncharacterized protein n=1 Tax=Acorus gramineus TaxID=55184 RepID=A0AAV9BSI8_ACOGR|nr:hypothetical protein QJS04_geneDACA004687 [Acorus gramineus]